MSLNPIYTGHSLEEVKKDAYAFTYLVVCADASLYCGWTNDLEKRIQAHNTGRGAKYTKPRTPISLVYFEAYQTKEEAMKREYEIKKMAREKKERLIGKI